MYTTSLIALGMALSTVVLGEGAGQATYYEGNVAAGTCSFSTYSLPSNIYGLALTNSLWSSSANCGRCISITGPSGNQITAMVVDKCPGCGESGLDLFQDGFAALADISQGRIDVNWQWTPCGMSNPLQVHLKEGASQWWFSAQVVGANKGIADLQVSTDGGSTWKGGLVRKDYNFFESSAGYGTDVVALRVLSVDGDEVVVRDVAVTDSNLVTASSNF